MENSLQTRKAEISPGVPSTDEDLTKAFVYEIAVSGDAPDVSQYAA